MAKKIKSKIETEQEIIQRQLEDIREKFVPDPPPSRILNVGDEVQVGNIKKSTVEQIFQNGKFYLLRQICTENNYGRPYDYERVIVYSWIDCFPIETGNKNLFEDSDIRISFSQRDMMGLLHCHYSFGIDDKMDYQRELVWELEDKVALIDSVFKNIDIGKFCLIHLDFKSVSDPNYEILDGKQRLNALKEFYESRFQYKGKFYHELSKRDRDKFENSPVSWGETKNLTNEQKYRYFLRLNTQGKPQSEDHLNKVKELWEKSKGELK